MFTNFQLSLLQQILLYFLLHICIVHCVDQSPTCLCIAEMQTVRIIKILNWMLFLLNVLCSHYFCTMKMLLQGKQDYQQQYSSERKYHQKLHNRMDEIVDGLEHLMQVYINNHSCDKHTAQNHKYLGQLLTLLKNIQIITT